MFEGEMVDADQINFETEKEPWSEYRFEDGTQLKLKSVLGGVWRLVDRYKPDGDPIYLLNVAGVPMMDVPILLKKAKLES